MHTFFLELPLMRLSKWFLISSLSFEQHENYVQKVESYSIFPFSLRMRIWTAGKKSGCWQKVGLFFLCIKYVIKCLFADQAKCSASQATTWLKTRSTAFKMFRGVSGHDFEIARKVNEAALSLHARLIMLIKLRETCVARRAACASQTVASWLPAVSVPSAPAGYAAPDSWHFYELYKWQCTMIQNSDEQ